MQTYIEKIKNQASIKVREEALDKLFKAKNFKLYYKNLYIE